MFICQNNVSWVNYSVNNYYLCCAQKSCQKKSSTMWVWLRCYVRRRYVATKLRIYVARSKRTTHFHINTPTNCDRICTQTMNYYYLYVFEKTSLFVAHHWIFLGITSLIFTVPLSAILNRKTKCTFLWRLYC